MDSPDKCQWCLDSVPATLMFRDRLDGKMLYVCERFDTPNPEKWELAARWSGTSWVLETTTPEVTTDFTVAERAQAVVDDMTELSWGGTPASERPQVVDQLERDVLRPKMRADQLEAMLDEQFSEQGGEIVDDEPKAGDRHDLVLIIPKELAEHLREDLIDVFAKSMTDAAIKGESFDAESQLLADMVAWWSRLRAAEPF